MLKKLAFFILIFCVSTSSYADLFADNEARQEILRLRAQIKELNTQIERIGAQYASEIDNLKARLNVIESDNKNLRDENERMRAALNNRLIAKENPEYQELRDEINAIYRLLLQAIPK